jgi:hypothetical protein
MTTPAGTQQSGYYNTTHKESRPFNGAAFLLGEMLLSFKCS